MKRIHKVKRLTVLFIFAIFAVFPAFSQNMQNLLEAERCFENGDYTCAISNYKEIVKTATGQDKMIVQAKLDIAEKCGIFAKIAKQEFDAKNWKQAKENYLEILKYNRNDANAQARLKDCDDFLAPRLDISEKNLLFPSSGGNKTITVTYNANTYSVDGLPAWCAVKEKYAGNFIVVCSANSGSAERTGNFTVTAGEKTERISVRQSGKEETKSAVNQTPTTTTAATTTSHGQVSGVQP
jgi:hypothetical protein